MVVSAHKRQGMNSRFFLTLRASHSKVVAHAHRRQARNPKRRSYITLIEVMIVMTLLAVLGGITAISISRAVQQERYNAGVAQVVNRLQLAQDIMLIARGDVQVSLVPDPAGLWCRVDVAQALVPILQRIADRTGIITGIGGFSWIPAGGSAVIDSPVSLNFQSAGSRLSRGELRLSSAGINDPNARQSYILLTGLAEPIISSDTSRYDQLRDGPAMGTNLERLYPAEVLEVFQQEQAKKKPKELSWRKRR